MLATVVMAVKSAALLMNSLILLKELLIVL